MIPFSAIQAAATQIAERFKPQKIILFGSYAYGKPSADSDVDYMVIFRGKDVEDRGIDIRMAIDFDFPVDVLVRSVTVFEKRIKMGDQFLIDINTAGKVLYEAADKRVGRKGRGRLQHGKSGSARKKVAQLR